jgi:hypothetical protein
MTNEWKKDREACDGVKLAESPGYLGDEQVRANNAFAERAIVRWPAALDEVERLREENARLMEWGEAMSQSLSDTAGDPAEEARRGLARYIDSHKPGPPEPPKGRNA